MSLREPLPDFPTVEQIHCWARMHAPTVRRELSSQGMSASDLVRPVHRDPGVREARADWRSRRPFPSDEEILLLMILMAPDDQENNASNEKAWQAVRSAIMMMAAPDPLPSLICLDLCCRKLIARE